MSDAGPLARALATGLALLAAAGCDPEEEGCLDYRALAIDVTADVACDGCCAYPALALQVSPARYFGDSTARLGRADDLIAGSDTLTDVALAFYLSDLAIELADGSLYPLTDTLTVVALAPGEGARRLEPSLALLEPYRASSYRVGAVLEPLEAVAIRATFGLPAELAGVRPGLQGAGSPLVGDRDSLLLPVGGGLLSGSVEAVASGGDTLAAAVVSRGGALRWAFGAPVGVGRGFDLFVSLALPLDGLAELTGELATGEVSAERFVTAVLAPGRVVDAAARR